MRLVTFAIAIALTSAPSWAAKTLDTPIERTPCTTIPLPSGGTACVPPKVSQVIVPSCIWVTIRESGKTTQVLVCTQPRPSKELPRVPQPKPLGGY